jgi:hypothetical protein
VEERSPEAGSERLEDWRSELTGDEGGSEDKPSGERGSEFELTIEGFGGGCRGLGLTGGGGGGRALALKSCSEINLGTAAS